MKRFNLVRIIGFIAFFVVSIFLLSLIFLNQIKSEILHLISVYGYQAIFFVTFIVEILPQPIGPEIPLLSGRIMGLSSIYVAILTVIGSVLASFANYKLGKFLYPLVCKDKKFAKYLTWYKKYGKYGLLVSSLGPVPYVPFCWFSGTFALSIRKFLLFGIFPRILRIIFISYILVLFF